MILEISGENQDLAEAEIRAIIESENSNTKLEVDERIVLAPSCYAFKRCAFTNYISEFLGVCELEDVMNFARNLKFESREFAVEVKNYSREKINTLELTKEVGYILSKKTK